METFRLTHTVDIDKQILLDILTTAWEGGINYWIVNGDFKNPTAIRDEELNITCIVFEGKGVIPFKAISQRRPCFNSSLVQENDKGVIYRIGPEDLIKAAEKILTSEPDRFGYGPWCAAVELSKGDAGDIDADAADCLVQIAAFGEMIYG